MTLFFFFQLYYRSISLVNDFLLLITSGIMILYVFLKVFINMCSEKLTG